MKTSIVLKTGIMALVVLMSGAGDLPAQTQMQSHVMGSGGGQAASASNNIVLTMGQTVVGSSMSPNGELDTGFWVAYWYGALSPVPEDLRTYKNQLIQNAPNPFNPMTKIRFSLAEEGRTRIEVFDLQGRRVAQLLDEVVAQGEHSVIFQPQRLASGVYLLRIESGSFCASRRLVLVK